MSPPDVVTTVKDLRARVALWRKGGERIALVPTMGALHAGHIALVAQAEALADRIVVSIFVNPTQFAPHEDLATYPRTFDADLDALGRRKVDLVYAPQTSEMYPGESSTVVSVGGPAEGLESVARPHFFAGVATVVTKLFVQCAPDVALFGEKDFQQVAVVRRLVRDLALPLEIVGIPTVREPDGLALSSRNAYLGMDERARAPALHGAMRRAADAISDGAEVVSALDIARNAIEAAGFSIDYLELRDAETLAPLAALDGRRARLLAAARLGNVRLIDNVPVASA